MVMTNPTAIKTALALMRRHPHWRFFPIASGTRAAPAGVVAAPNDSLRAADARSAGGYGSPAHFGDQQDDVVRDFPAGERVR